MERMEALEEEEEVKIYSCDGSFTPNSSIADFGFCVHDKVGWALDERCEMCVANGAKHIECRAILDA